MPVILTITSKSEPEKRNVREFQQDVITIGRNAASNLHLEDKQRLISRKHASIKKHQSDYYLVDHKSRNGTLLNNLKMPGEKMAKLKDDDVIEISEFVIYYKFEPDVATQGDETLFIKPPFSDEVKQVLPLINKIKTLLKDRTLFSTPEELQFALQLELTKENWGEIGKLFAAALAAVYKVEAAGEAPTRNFLPMDDPELMVKYGKILELFLNFGIEAVKSVNYFNETVIAHTIVQNKKNAISNFNADELQAFLLDGNISEAVVADRLKKIAFELHNAKAHPFALLQGYRAAAVEGTKALLGDLDIDRLEAEMSAGHYTIGPIKIPRNWPVIKLWAKYQAYLQTRERMKKLLEDPGHVERLYYKKQLTDTYQKAMVAAREEYRK